MKNRTIRMTAGVICICFLQSGAFAQQVPDPSFHPPIEKPAYAQGKGPLVRIDEAHFNFHTAGGRYQAFAEMLRRDGYVVEASAAKFSKAALRPARVLVIANALAEANQSQWTLPTPSAFTAEEIDAVRDWVNEGGALLLIVDHMPMPGAAGELAKAFGVTFSNGYAMKPKNTAGDFFTRAHGTLKDHAITAGRTRADRIESVRSFTGSAFQVEKATPLMVFPEGYVSFLTTTAGQIDDKTPSVPVTGWLQGAVLTHGKGRVAIFGEAAMFSAQLAGPNRGPMGMNAPNAKQNPQFLLNVLHWLTGVLN